MPFMMTDTASIEEKMAIMARAIDELIKTVEEKNTQFAFLMDKLEAQNIWESSQGHSQPPSFMPSIAPTKNEQVSALKHLTDRTLHNTSIGSLSVQQLQDMITNTIRGQFAGPPQSFLMYSKPYTKRIDNLRMPVGYQPPKFQQFDGKGNPKQHVAHFIKTCNNDGIDGDLLVKQFVRSLKGNAFD